MEDVTYVFTLLESILASVFGIIILVVLLVAVLAIAIVGLAFEIVMLPISLVALLLYYVAGIGSMDWWNSTYLWFVEAGETVISFMQGLIGF